MRTDLDNLREEFSKVDRKDPASLKKWFDTHPHLSLYDLAQIIDRGYEAARKLRKRAGINGRQTMTPPIVHNLPKAAIEVPENWRTKEWLSKAIQLYGLNGIATAVNRNRHIIRKLLNRFNIPWNKSVKTATKSKNKFCTHAWCYQHYVTLRLSQQRCAELAGICRQTFVLWLTRFKIPVRKSFKGKSIPSTWEDELVYNLKRQKIVKRVKETKGHIHVRYRNYFWENYYTELKYKPKRPYTFFQITPDSSKIKHVPLVFHEFGTDIEGKPYFPAHISINRRELDDATLIERRLAIHEYARLIQSRGWVWPTFPDEVIEYDLNDVRNFNMAAYLENGGFTAVPRNICHHPGKRLMLHFFDFSMFQERLKRPSYLIRLLNKLADTSKKFSFFNLITLTAARENLMASWVKYTKPISNPVVYCAIFKRLGLTGTVMDLTCGFGNRAIACAATGLEYTTPDPAFQGVIDRGFVDFSGLKYVPFSDQNVDTVIYDEGSLSPQMEKVIPYLGKTKKLLVFVPNKDRESVMKYKPTSAIRLRTRFHDKNPGYLFVW